MEIGKALRFNEGKLRYDLLPVEPLKEIAKVFTFGAEKYDDNNWRAGMPWSKCIASLERHIAAIKAGEDQDSESGLLHAAHAATNLIFLLEYYKTYPMGDDRYQKPNFRIGLDIDEVLADWLGHWLAKYGGSRPKWWNFDRFISTKFQELKDVKDFWMNIPVRTNPDDLKFEPTCYITARCIPNEWTEEWLDKNGFPVAPVVTVKSGNEKLEAMKEFKLDIFVDDNYNTFKYLNANGQFCYLFDTAHNDRFQVGHKRIYNLKDL